MRVFPKDLGSLFAKRPIILGETTEAYDELLSKATAAVDPTDILEAIWVKDIVDLIWESQRLRRLKAGLLLTARKTALERIIQVTDDPVSSIMRDRSELQTLGSRWLEGEVDAHAEVAAILKQRGLNLDSVMAQALSDKLIEIERIDRMIASADARRNKALSEIERRRESLARRVKSEADDIPG
ncbi:hypothetical protein [Microvirga aerophila]|uniref:Uncharacterized protein n=1 Tax=Microvirga aerophila TaxID=670291 RepID=A0A512BV14_9HYPH|nr:hypothetical protein [Microvirga aerophila]GEO15780.1 hypothetical protein MAE02_34760 [Microvirga aerophila]